MAVGRDVGGEAALQLGIVVDRLVVDQQAIEGTAADRVVQDRGHLAIAPAGAVGDLGGTVGGAGQLAKQKSLAAVSRTWWRLGRTVVAG